MACSAPGPTFLFKKLQAIRGAQGATKAGQRGPQGRKAEGCQGSSVFDVHCWAGSQRAGTKAAPRRQARPFCGCMPAGTPHLCVHAAPVPRGSYSSPAALAACRCAGGEDALREAGASRPGDVAASAPGACGTSSAPVSRRGLQPLPPAGPYGYRPTRLGRAAGAVAAAARRPPGAARPVDRTRRTHPCRLVAGVNWVAAPCHTRYPWVQRKTGSTAVG